MNTVMTLAALATVTALSFAAALGMEWLCLRGAFLLLPHANRKLRFRVRGSRRAPAAPARFAHQELSQQS
ncbi:MAG TPA: hypothetical protein VKE24_06575 [Candidatus Acidoferrales bacterium]|nr:hypothetical protein [Candidatus Acidoferrales bacterium]